MGLTADEKKMLKQLQRKAEEPDPAPMGTSRSVHIDLSNPTAVKNAIKWGFLSGDNDGDDGGDDEEEVEDGSDDEDTDETPKRRGYFND